MMRMMFGRRHFEQANDNRGGLGQKEKEHIDAIYRAIDCFPAITCRITSLF